MRLFAATILFLFTLPALGQSWTQKQGVSMTSASNGYYEFLPSVYNGVTKLPCIIFVHGLGEVGNGTSQLVNLLNFGLPAYINSNQSTFNGYGAVIICPQFSSAYPGGAQVENIINYVRSNYVIDTSRVYLTGMSMGGGTVLDWADVGNVYKVAAIAPVCPISSPQTALVNKYKAYGMPFWFIHSQDDPTVGFSNSTNWQTSLNAAPSIAPIARLDSINGYGHAAWDYAYNPSQTMGAGTNLIQWLLSKRRTDYDGNGVDDGNLFSGAPTLTNTLMATIGGTLYRYLLYSDGTYTRETHNGTSWQSASPTGLNLRGRISSTSYRWVFTAGGTYTTQTFISGNWQ